MVDKPKPAAAIPYGKIDAPGALGAVIRAKRRSITLRQAELAGLAGVGIRFLSELENGKPTAEIGKVMKVLGALGLELWVQPRAPGRGGSRR